MSNRNLPKPKVPAAAGSTGNLLSSVAPPSELPNFITTPVPQVASDNLLKKEIINIQSQNVQASQSVPSQSLPQSQSSDFLQTTFSPAIPASKGAPTEATLPDSAESSSELTTPSSVDSTQPSLQSAHEADEFIGDPMPGSGIFTWMKGAVSTGGLLHRVAEKAMSSVDSMITTLDPQMKEYMHSGGDITILVASDKENKVSPIREAFQNVFGKATVVGLPSQPSRVAAQPVGYAAGLAAAKDRIGQLRATNTKIGNNMPVIAVEGLIIEVTSDRWFDLSVVVLTDPVKGLNLEVYTQMTPIPFAVIAAAKGDTPEDYEFKETGFSTTVGSYMGANLQTHHSHWHETSTGVSRREMIYLAAKSLAVLYKKATNTSNS